MQTAPNCPGAHWVIAMHDSSNCNGRVTDTLWSKNGDSDTGFDALQGAVGVRVKPFTALNVMAAVERTFPLGSSTSTVTGWCAWVMAQASAPICGSMSPVGGPRSCSLKPVITSTTRGTISTANGRSAAATLSAAQVRVGSVSPMSFDYDSKMNSGTDADGSTESSSGKAGGVGVGNVRYWFREDAYNAPRSYVDFSLQYRVKVMGDDRWKACSLA